WYTPPRFSHYVPTMSPRPARATAPTGLALLRRIPMSAPPLPETALPDSWGQVLDRMRQSLDAAVGALAERERQLPPAPPAEALAAREAKRQQAFAHVEQGLEKLRTSVEQAEQQT